MKYKKRNGKKRMMASKEIKKIAEFANFSMNTQIANQVGMCSSVHNHSRAYASIMKRASLGIIEG